MATRYRENNYNVGHWAVDSFFFLLFYYRPSHYSGLGRPSYYIFVVTQIRGSPIKSGFSPPSPLRHAGRVTCMIHCPAFSSREVSIKAGFPPPSPLRHTGRFTCTIHCPACSALPPLVDAIAGGHSKKDLRYTQKTWHSKCLFSDFY